MTEVELDPAWQWAEMPWGPALQCLPLGCGASHFFTTRMPVLGAAGQAADDGWRQVAAALDVPADAVVRLEQVHGRAVLVAREGRPGGGRPAWGVADACVTGDATLALSVRVADCVPALLVDRRSGAVGAVHAGWRGTCAGVAGAAVEALASQFGSEPADLIVAIGPSIGPCCYRVGSEVQEAFAAHGHGQARLERWLVTSPARPARCGVPGAEPSGAAQRSSRFLDTWTANADQYEAAGVPRAQIHVSGVCTSCYREVFHSYRVDGPRAGRMVGVIRGKTEDRR